MTRALPRTNFHSSNLIRCLADLSLAETVEPGNAFAEQLALWIHFADAITLSAVHASGMAGRPAMFCAAAGDARATLGREFDRIQGMLTNSVLKSFSPALGKTHIPLPPPELVMPKDLGAAYLPYRRFYESHQRDMELSIQPLRTNAREALAKASPRLRKLAELDGMFEKILRERESKLLSKVPVLLKKRFEQLCKTHQQNVADTQQADNPAAWTQAGGWLARFCSDMQMLLLAEVELRLQPTLGLIEAFKQDTQ